MTTSENFQYTFSTSKSTEELFRLLQDPQQWWMGVFGEEIIGASNNIDDEFEFRAGDGAHYSKQRLSELMPGKKITWLVTESHLNFLQKTDEWTGTSFGFSIESQSGKNLVTFTHFGLLPSIECYMMCSDGWSRYLKNLEKKLV